MILRAHARENTHLFSQEDFQKYSVKIYSKKSKISLAQNL